MTWSKVDDGFYDHPKTVAAGPLGIALFICGLSYSSRYLTDGFIAQAMVKRLIDVDDPQAVAEKLVEVGLWEQAKDGYHIHDFLDYNPSAAEVKAQRQANAERQAKWRQERDKDSDKPPTGAVNDTVTNDVSNDVINNTPVPDPVPGPTPEIEKIAPAKAGEPPPKRRKPRTKQKTPVAIRVFRENAHYYPAKAWYENVADVVGDKPADLTRWGQVVKAWVGLGWNPTNVKGMLEFFARGEIPTGRSKKPEPYQGIKEWVAEQEAVI